jgi:hypothetical protein
MHKVVHYRYISLFFLLICICLTSFSQKSDSIKIPMNLGATITLTSKGISSIPNLTLGKPAVIFYLSAGKKVRFEPEFRIAMEGKPWMLIFWGRYDLLNTNRFFIKTRANTSLVFNTISVTTDGVTSKIMKASRTLTGDILVSYFITKNISVSPYYMYAYGIEKNALKNTHYLALRTGFSNIKLSDQYSMAFSPSVYFLKIDKNSGYYFNSTISLSKRNFPLAVSALVNKTINTKIPIGENFLWNVNLIYTFNKKYVEQ